MRYTFNNANRNLQKYDGQEVTYLGKALGGLDVPEIDPKAGSGDEWHRIRFQDGVGAIVHSDELINPAGAV